MLVGVADYNREHSHMYTPGIGNGRVGLKKSRMPINAVAECRDGNEPMVTMQNVEEDEWQASRCRGVKKRSDGNSTQRTTQQQRRADFPSSR